MEGLPSKYKRSKVIFISPPTGVTNTRGDALKAIESRHDEIYLVYRDLFVESDML